MMARGFKNNVARYLGQLPWGTLINPGLVDFLGGGEGIAVKNNMRQPTFPTHDLCQVKEK